MSKEKTLIEIKITKTSKGLKMEILPTSLSTMEQLGYLELARKLILDSVIEPK